MAGAFRRRGSKVVGRLDEREAGLIAELLQQTALLLALPEDETEQDPFTQLTSGWGQAPSDEELAQRDSALRRLLPDASRDDPEAAAEFRRLTENDLRRSKAARLRSAADLLLADRRHRHPDRVSLSLQQAQELTIALTDVRLVLADRVGLRTDEDGERLHRQLEETDDLRDPAVVLYAYYEFLTWVQESLALALTD